MAAHTEIIVWGGEVFTTDEVAAGLGRQHSLVGISDDLLLGNPADAPLGLDDYMNHSCRSNVGMVDEITLVTMRNVAAGEELAADYAIWLNDEAYVMGRPCSCSATNCRRTVRGTDWRLPAVRLHNRNFFSPFIARRITNEAD